MDSRRHSGSHGRSSSQYYDNDYQTVGQAPLTGNKQPFSARAGQGAPNIYDPNESHRMTSQSYDSEPLEDDRLDPGSRRVRAPLAAPHVPKLHQKGPKLDTRVHDSNRTGLSPTSPLSPRHGSSARSQPRGSVSDRSPLQRLEGKLDDISKEEKRSRMEEAEHRARQREQGNPAANQSRRVDNQYPRQSSGQTGQAASINSGHAAVGRRHSSAPQPVNIAEAHQPERRSIDYRDQPFEPVVNRSNPTHSSQAIDASHKFRRASDALRQQNQPRASNDMNRESHQPDYFQPRTSRDEHDRGELERNGSKNYRHRLRDAGYAGAAAAASTPSPKFGLDGTRGDSGASFDQRDHGSAQGLGRNDSKRLQKKSAPQEYSTGNKDRHHVPDSQQQLHGERMGVKQGLKAAITHQEPDPVPPESVQIHGSRGPAYRIPPQTAGGQQAREQVGFGEASSGSGPQQTSSNAHHSRLGNFLHGHRDEARLYQRGPVLNDWRNAGIAKLTVDDLMIEDQDRGGTNASSGRRYSSERGGGPGAYDGPYDEEAKSFRPPLLLKCGPLLRYTGLRRETPARTGRSNAAGRDIWRGSVMIVTLDSHSSYESGPTLRLFAQPMDLLQPPPQESHDLPPEYADPIAGQVKVSRTGRALFVKPVDHLEEGLDVSRVEDESGLFETTKSPSLGAQHVSGPDGRQHQHITTQNRSRIRRRDGERAGKYRDVRGARLHTERGVTFWRFNIEIDLGPIQARVAYRINRGPAIGFWVPARGESMNIMFHSCNGFSLSVNPNLFSGPDPLWRDVLNKHQHKPFHVMLGGGDQIYNDAATRDTELFREWLQTKNPEHKHRAEFSAEMQDELEAFYLNRYSMWFSQGMFGLANSQIPMVNIWDDHDIIDGFGSYPHHFMSTKVFTGLGAVAFKYYMLFQHQSVPTESQREEPSWLLGASPGPYINELSRSIFMFLGRKIAFLGLDCRTERMRDEVLSQGSYDIIFDRCRTEIIKGETKHLIVLLGVPIAYPRLNFLENILTSRIMDPIKAIGRTGVLGGFVNKFDGGVEILDDLDDHWTAKHHKAERNWFIQELQELAAEKSVRVTILGGDVHLGAVGQFYTKKKLGITKDRDHRYMPNVISSAIVNTPPPTLMGDVLNKRNKIHHLDAETDEDMIPMFEQDVDGKSRNNLHLLPRRNYCTIREYVPGSTPPPSPRLEAQTPGSPWSQSQDTAPRGRYPPGSMKRTLSLTGGSFRPGNLVRRLSGSRTRASSNEISRGQDYRDTDNRGFERDSRPSTQERGSYFPPNASAEARPTFRRRPTNLSEKAALKAAARGGADANVEGHEAGHIDLEGGLDIALNMEVSQLDPAGVTAPYRLLVPALWYEGAGDPNTARFKSRGASLMDRLRGRNNDREGGYSGSESESRGSSLERETQERPSGVLPNTNVGRVGHDNGRRAFGHDGTNDTHFGRNDTNLGRNDTRLDRNDTHFGRNDTHLGRNDTHLSRNGTHLDRNNKELGPPPGPHPASLPRRNKEYDVSAPRPSAPHPSQVRRPEERRLEERPEAPRKERRSFSGGLFGFHRNKRGPEGYDSQSGSDSDTGSYTESDIDSVEAEQQAAQAAQARQRRPSKTDRFFGIGDDSNNDRRQGGSAPIQQVQPNGLPYEGKSKGWKLWK